MTTSLASNSFERVRDAAEAAGLNWREVRAGIQASMQTPGHSGRDLGTSVTYTGDQVLVNCFNGDVGDVLDALGLTFRDLFDNPKGSRYEYAGGLAVTRTPAKVFQRICEHGINPSKCDSCKEKLWSLYGLASLGKAGPVYVVEGEKDVNTARTVHGVAAVSQVGGADPDKTDWSSLKGRDVIVVRDNDKPGHRRAEKVRTHLESMVPAPASVTVVDVAVETDKADLSDHIAAGKDLSELVPVDVPAETPARRITLVKASTVRTERLDWLIPNWVPRRSMTLLAGREGLGKSTIACDFAAQATRGELDGKPMNVAYLNTEDSRSITVAPRLLAAGADMDRVFFFDVTTETGHAGSLQLPGDTQLLARALAAENVGLVILDAAKSAMHSSLDGYRDDDVRQFLEPLASMCDEHDMSIIGLVHFGKRESNDPGKLILGSVAWSQIARSVLSVAVDDEGTLVVTNTKGNLAPSQISREARLESVTVPTDDGRDTSVGRVVWGDETSVSAADLLVSHDDDQDDERTEAEEWLEDYLKGSGPTPRLEVLKEAQKQRIASERTIKRAFKSIGGVSERSGFPAVAVWSLPDGPRGIDYTAARVGAGPTGPTGADLHKQGGPTVGEEKGEGPTSGPPALTSGNVTNMGDISTVGPLPTRTAQQPDPTGDTELENTIIGSLHDEYPIGLKTVEQSVPPEHRGDVAGVLGKLVNDGRVVLDNRGRFLLNSTRKEIA